MGSGKDTQKILALEKSQNLVDWVMGSGKDTKKTLASQNATPIQCPISNW